MDLNKQGKIESSSVGSFEKINSTLIGAFVLYEKLVETSWLAI